MTAGNITTLPNDKVPTTPDKALKAELQREGLKQAAAFVEKQSTTISLSATQTSVGFTIYQRSMQQNVVIDGRRSTDAPEKKETEKSSSFDFEEVANNVMRFVGGVINAEAKGGASQEKLASLFEQARTGIAKGIKMAQRDIGEQMNDDISTGIAKSRNLMEERLSALENRLSGTTPEGPTTIAAITSNTASQQAGEVKIRTRDGDELFISFGAMASLSSRRDVGITQTDLLQQDNSADVFTSNSIQLSESLNFSLRITGDIDDDEKEAINGLVKQVYDLADSFFDGNLDKAFSEALSLGYDETELVGYSLQLRSYQQSDVLKTYGQIKHYADGDKNTGHGDIAKPFSQYVEKLLTTLKQANEWLANDAEYTKIANGLIGAMPDVQVPDLIAAINRFHEFNNKFTLLPQKTSSEGTSE